MKKTYLQPDTCIYCIENQPLMFGSDAGNDAFDGGGNLGDFDENSMVIESRQNLWDEE